MRNVWLGFFLWGLTLGPIPTVMLAKMLALLGAGTWLAICIVVAGFIWIKIDDWIIEHEGD